MRKIQSFPDIEETKSSSSLARESSESTMAIKAGVMMGWAPFLFRWTCNAKETFFIYELLTFIWLMYCNVLRLEPGPPELSLFQPASI